MAGFLLAITALLLQIGGADDGFVTVFDHNETLCPYEQVFVWPRVVFLDLTMSNSYSGKGVWVSLKYGGITKRLYYRNNSVTLSPYPLACPPG